jgi:hypothetical protein
VNWLTDLLKYFSLSKSFTAAVFVTSLTLLVGPKMFPQAFGTVPAEWRWVVVAACIFSFVLLAIWAVPEIVKGAFATPSRLRNNPKFNPPTEKEQAFVYFLGLNHPNDACNLDQLNHTKISKLEFLQLCASLQQKGLVRVNEYTDDLVSLTKNGRAYAMELIGQQPKT